MLDCRSKKLAIKNDEPLVFQALSWYAEDFDMRNLLGEEDESIDMSFYTIKVFGLTADGKTVSVSVKNFTPYFYVKVPDDWTRREVQALKDYVLTQLPFQGSLASIKMMERMDFWGYSNKKMFKFVRLCFRNHASMRKIMYKFNYDVTLKGCNIRKIKLRLYEANIDPFIRFIHIKDLEPSGWISIPAKQYTRSTEILESICSIDVEADWTKVQPYACDDTAPFVVASFDIECTSSSGEFPVPKKDYKQLASQLYDAYKENIECMSDYDKKEAIQRCLDYALGICEDAASTTVHKVQFKREMTATVKERIKTSIAMYIDDICTFLTGRYALTSGEKPTREKIVGNIANYFNNKMSLPEVQGDSIIQIGTTFHYYGQKECCYKHIITLGTCDPIDGVTVETCENEEELLMKWNYLVRNTNPDIMTGYNIFGFDFWYMVERAKELGIDKPFMKLSRLHNRICQYKENKLSSSALGDNILRFIDMEGRVLVDLMKVVQRDHKLDSYKLDNVAHHFMGMNKNDVSPQDIFRLQKGTSADRNIIADYCVQDCALCNHLIMKLEIVANNMGMSNVCLVPLSYIFMRGQGIKIFSLVLKQCKEEGFMIPVVRPPKKLDDAEEDPNEDSYEGAIVLEPKEGIYIDDPISVLDYASLYPSSMISENLSHDCLVLPEDMDKYGNLPDVEYLDISYDIYEGVGDKKVKTGERVCRFVQPPNGEKGVIPNILMKLLKARKTTRKKIEMKQVTLKNGTVIKGFYDDKEGIVVTAEGDKHQAPIDQVESTEDVYNEFQKAVLDGLQNAYKVTANSLYGQIGAKTSPIYMKDIAACTTATGRKMIMLAKNFLEENYNANIIYGDSVTGDTPLLIKYPDNTIDIVTIETLADKWEPYHQFKPDVEGLSCKEQAELEAKVWANGHWADIRRVIRHKTNKPLYRVNTYRGCVDITSDHSLIDINGNEIKPTHCVVDQTQIFHTFPDEFCEHKLQLRGYTSQKFMQYTDANKTHTCRICNEDKTIDQFYKNGKGYETRCRLCVKNIALQKQGKAPSTSIIKKVLNYNVPQRTVSKEEAWVWGYFFGDGSCGDYKCANGNKMSWALNSNDKSILHKAHQYLNMCESKDIVDFKILETLESSGVYKLVPCGSIKYMVEKYRELMYDYNKHKKVPKLILNASQETRQWFFDGYYVADGTQKPYVERGKINFACKGKIGAQGLFYLAKSLGYSNLRITTTSQKDDTYWIYDTTDTHYKDNKDYVKKIYDLGSSNGAFVFDIETSCGMFHAGVGECLARNTDSIFIMFPNTSLETTIDVSHDQLETLKGKAKIMPSIQTAIKASNEIKKLLKKPHDLEYEKTFWPFILLSKKRYVGNLYETNDKKFKQKSMGIVLKRRDNANIVKRVYGGIIDTILNRQDIPASVTFLQNCLNELVNGQCPMDDLVITKSLRSEYKDPTKIAHKVLAERMGERDPGNKPQVNDRIPFVYVQTPPPENKKEKVLQGERIEHPDFIKKNNLKPDYNFYITNQIMKPILQLYSIVIEQLPGFSKTPQYYDRVISKIKDEGIDDIRRIKDKLYQVKEMDVKELLFDPVLSKLDNFKKTSTRIAKQLEKEMASEPKIIIGPDGTKIEVPALPPPAIHEVLKKPRAPRKPKTTEAQKDEQPKTKKKAPATKAETEEQVAAPKKRAPAKKKTTSADAELGEAPATTITAKRAPAKKKAT